MDIKDVIQKCGGASRIARETGRHHTTILEWRRVPAQYVIAVERLSGIPRHILRADVFPAPDVGATDAHSITGQPGQEAA